MKEIPFHRAYVSEEAITSVVETLRSGWLTMGPKTVKFEEEFSRWMGARHSVAVSSCTAALHLALRIVGLAPGDEVIVPAMTFAATAEVACYFNATPVVVDVEKDTHNMDVSKMREAVSSRTKAIMPVHYGGQPCDMDEIMEFAESRGLYVIEDAAHAIPSWYKGRKIGTIGDITCFSFYATKSLATGEGGMLCTESSEWADMAKTLRLHGMSKDAWNRYSSEGAWFYRVADAGYKYNMTDIQAALGLVQLEELMWMYERRRDIALRYNDAFASMDGIFTPSVKPDRETSWHLYVIKLNTEALSIDRNSFINMLGDMGIGTSVHFIPLYRHDYYGKTFGLRPEDYPNSEWIYERLVSLPIYPTMTDDDVDRVINAVGEVARRHKA